MSVSLSVPTPGPSPSRVERFEAIVIGAGQAGLAAGYHLAARDVDFVMVDGDARIGDVWRRRWDSLRLFTPARYSGLPGMPFPAEPYHLPDKDEVADYLERYADRFDLPVRLGTRVTSMSRNAGRYLVRTGSAILEADNVIVATGPFQRPKIPTFAGALARDIHQMHSSAYRSPFDLPDGPALVVGAGNSGAQIALELARFRTVWLAGKETGHIPRAVLGRDVYDWIWPVINRLTVETRLGQRLRERVRRGDPLIGIPARRLASAGIERVGRVTEVRDGRPVCDGAALDARSIVWSTGFVPDYSWIDLDVFDAEGYPRHRRGEVVESPGLYFLGLRFQHRMSSALIGGVGDDADHVATLVARRAEVALPAHA